MNNTVMKDVAKAENAFTSDKTMRYKYILREKAIRDYYSGLDEARQEGVRQGLAQGREQGLAAGAQQEKIANILGMLREGIAIPVIAKITSCSEAEIQRIANEQASS